jgi:hypothetical protein
MPVILNGLNDFSLGRILIFDDVFGDIFGDVFGDIECRLNAIKVYPIHLKRVISGDAEMWEITCLSAILTSGLLSRFTI